jgi:serine/threonine-protein kinase
LLVGRAYWAEESKNLGDMIAFAMHVVNGPQEPAVERAARHGVALPPDFDAWFAKGTAVDPTKRFATASEAVRSLREVAGLAAIAPFAVRPPIPSDSGASLPESRPMIAAVGLRERAITSTGASVITAPPQERRRVPVVASAAAAMLGLGLLGAVAWWSLRPETASLETSNQAVVAASTTASAAVTAAPTASSAVAVEVVPSAVAEPAAAPSARLPAGVKAAPRPAAKKKPVVDEPNYTRR